MRKYCLRGVDRNRYMELYYYARRYDTLPEREQRRIREIAEKVTEGAGACELLRGVCFGVPYKSLDLPWSERGYSRLRRRFFEELDKVKR
ncbi:MAG: hypothetical protein IJV67_02540 [Clostridia bacterium]|nr:hypothetical protein [Clostridia bacterium]